MKTHSLNQLLGFVVGIVLIFSGVVWIGSKLNLLTGFPKGVDAYAHLTRIAWILTRFPQIHWNPSWNSGTYFWLWSYPPTSSLISALLVKILSLTPEFTLTLVALFSMLVFALGIYLTMAFWCGVWLSLPLTLLALFIPALWSWWGHGGNYIRIWGIGFYALTLALAVYYLKKPGKWRYVFLVLGLGLTLTTHMLFTALALVSVGGYILFAVVNIKEKVRALLKILGVGVLLSSFWYVPMLFSSTGERFFEPSMGGPVAFSSLLAIADREPYFSLPLYFTVFLLLTFIMGVVLIFWGRKKEHLIWAVLPTFAFGLFGAFAYAFGRNFSWFPKSLSASGFAPFAALPFMIIFACFLAAGVVGSLLSKFRNSWFIVIASLFISTGIIGIAVSRDYAKYMVYDMTAGNQVQHYAIPPVKQLTLSDEYRFGSDSAFVSDWFNYLYPNFPQTRDYISNGIPYMNWQYLLEYSLWTQADRIDEAKWLLDWYGIKYFTVGYASGNTSYDKFFDNGDIFINKYADSKAGYYLYEYKDAKPIMQTAKAKAILVVGEIKDYEVLVRAFAMADIGIDKAVPVYGGEDVSKLDARTLTSFPVLFIYRLGISNLKDSIIKNYLEKGGRVVIEASQEEEIINAQWVPVEKTRVEKIAGSWEFTQKSGELVDIAESGFSPPLFGNQAWKIVVASPRAGSEVLLASKNLPVVVKSRVGQGQVYWLGLNLAYHAESFRNEKEVGWLGKLIGVSDESKSTLGKVEMVKNEPQKRIWKITAPAGGLIWKETFFPRWEVTWLDSAGKKGKLDVFMAGPALSYIPLPSDIAYPLTLKANYHLSFFDWLGWGITITTLFMLVMYLLNEHFLLNILNKLDLSKRIGGWWDEKE